ncbi:MAG: phosphoribosylanthranilate isomerase [Bacteroidota bacterium]|nr:phosphoribosylanthranilate isomerase [Bacteroidota bacterium]
MTLQIKVCGMRDPHNLEEVCDLTPEYVGFIFYERSGRFVGKNPDPALFNIPGPGIRKVGVFVDEELKQVRKAIENHGLDLVQLHGKESVEYCRSLSGVPVDVIKVLDPPGTDMDPEEYMEVADLLLFDSAGAGSGGTGRKFDWSLLDELKSSVPFLLSGGIGPGDAAPVRALGLEGLIGVDVNSRFELLPGMKDVESLKEFITEIRK